MIISKTEPKSTTCSKHYYYVFFSASKYQTSLPIISTYVSIINQGRKMRENAILQRQQL
jgi:hypothetical protein